MAPKENHLFRYPVAHRDDVADDCHGTRVPDPYRWLEDPDSMATREWVAAENALTSAYLETVDARPQLRARIEELWDYPRYSVPYQRGGRYFFSRNSGLQNQDVLYVQNSRTAKPRVVVDPNTFSEDGTVALTNQAVDEAGELLAYGTSRSGSDWQQIHIRRVDSGEEYPETIDWTRFTAIAWRHDSAGFYYARFPELGSVPEADRNQHRVYWHALGSFQAEDALVFEEPTRPNLIYAPTVTDDGAYLVLHVFHGTDAENGLYYRPIAGEGDFVRLLEVGEAKFELVGNVGSTFYFHTDLNAPRGRIMAVDLERPDRADWREIVPEQDDVIAFVALVDDRFAVAYMHHAHHRLKVCARDGSPAGEIDVPAPGSITGMSGRQRDTELFLGFQSFLQPTTIYRYDMRAQQLETFHAPEIAFDPSDFETRQVFYTSRDGTRVPMFVTQPKGLARDGNAPTLLYGYGGFDVSLTPVFSVSQIAWLEAGGVIAVPNLRGGGEYGAAWHQGGMLERKQNVFDDFIAAAEWLIANDYTRPARLASMGGSNGGLLVAATMLQRPDLFGAVVCRVPVTDMLRYHKFTIGRYWVGEYGNAEENADHFAFLSAYSPLHNVTAGADYPPVLITSADTDDRVVPAHAKKFAATLQASGSTDRPRLLRVETKAGHGLGKPTSKLIDELADIYAFLFDQLDVTLDQSGSQ